MRTKSDPHEPHSTLTLHVILSVVFWATGKDFPFHMTMELAKLGVKIKRGTDSEKMENVQLLKMYNLAALFVRTQTGRG